MAYTITTPCLGNPKITAIDDTAKVALGTVVQAVDPTLGAGEFIYLKGVASTAANDAVAYDAEGYTTTRTVAASIGDIAVAMAAVLANQFGWYQVRGKGVVKVLASFADNAQCYLTATPGSVDDADVAGDLIIGMIGASAIDTPSTGLAYVRLNRPHVAAGAVD